MRLLAITLAEGVQIAVVAGIFGLLNAWLGLWLKGLYENRKSKKAASDRQDQANATVRTAEITDQATTRAELWAEIRALRAEQGQQRTNYERMLFDHAKSAASMEALQRQVADLLKEREVLSKQVEHVEALEAENKLLSAKVAELTTLNTTLQKRVQAQDDEFQAQVLAFQQEIAGLRLEISKLISQQKIESEEKPV